MGQITKYILYALFGIFAFLWVSQIYKSCNKSKIINSGNISGQLEQTDDPDDLTTLDEEAEKEDLIVYNEEDEGFGEDEERLDGDEFLDEEVETTDNTIEEADADSEAGSYADSGGRLSKSADNNSGKEDSFSSKGSADSSKKFMVIAGSFENQTNAKTLVRQLERKGFDNAEIVKFIRSDFHSVCAGRFYNQGDANELAASLKKAGVPAYVHLRRTR